MAIAMVAGRGRASEPGVARPVTEDLAELEWSGELPDDIVERYRLLAENPLDLNTASAKELSELPGITAGIADDFVAARQRHGAFTRVEELVSRRLLSPSELATLRPYIRVAAPGRLRQFGGSVHARIRGSPSDNLAPPFEFIGELRVPHGLRAGVALSSTRHIPDEVVFSPQLDGLSTSGFHYRALPSRYFVEWTHRKLTIIAGTFDVGFAAKLTLDTSRKATPDGFTTASAFAVPSLLSSSCRLAPAADACVGMANLRVTGDARWADPFRGVALSLRDVEFGARLRGSAYAFVSYASHHLNQTQVADVRTCVDDCPSVTVLLSRGPYRLVRSTLPNFFDELAGGGHFEVSVDRRFTFGVTGYGALPFMMSLPGGRFDFRPSSRWPAGGPYGAAGFDASARWGRLSVGVEVARSFSSDAGGFGVIQRTAYRAPGPLSHDASLSLRYYDAGFDNPYGRPVSAADAFEGSRARNEAGARAGYALQWRERLGVNAHFDLWTNPTSASDGTPAWSLNASGGLRVSAALGAGADVTWWGDAAVRSIRLTANDGCDAASENVSDASACIRERYATGLHLHWERAWLHLAGSAAMSWSRQAADTFTPKLTAHVSVSAAPAPVVALRAVGRYLDANFTRELAEKRAFAGVDVRWNATDSVAVTAGYGALFWLDSRASTLARFSNPEHRLSLEVRASF